MVAGARVLIDCLGRCVSRVDLLAYVPHLYITTIAVDAPAVLLHAVDAVGVANDIVDVEDKDRVVDINIYVVRPIQRSRKEVTINIRYETYSSLLLEVHLSHISIFGIDDERVEDIRTGIACYGYTKLILSATGDDRE